MQAYGHVFVFTVSLGVFLFIFWLVRRRKIRERFAILWLLIAFVLLTTSSIGYPYLFKIASLVGVPYPPSALFFLAIAGLTLLVIELLAWVSKLNDRTRVLTQQLAILRERVEKESLENGEQRRTRS